MYIKNFENKKNDSYKLYKNKSNVLILIVLIKQKLKFILKGIKFLRVGAIDTI